jgi:hypothetical protein
MQGNRFAFGVVAILAGIIILLGKLGFFHFFWPLLFIAIGIGLHMSYFRGSGNSQSLVYAGISVTYGLIFFYCKAAGWNQLSWLWPGFILGIAIGLYEKYVYGGRQSPSALYGAISLAIVSTVFFFLSILFHSGATFIAICLIILGGYVVLRARRA